MSKERIEKLKKLIRDNKAFNKEYKKEIKQLESETLLEVGRWYKYGNFLLHIKSISNDIIGRYGFNMLGDWHECVDELAISNELTLATDKEIEEALIKEAKKRGFKEGVTFKSLIYACTWTIEGSNFETNLANDLMINLNYIFRKGKWAEIIKTTHVPEGDYTTAQLKDLVILSENK